MKKHVYIEMEDRLVCLGIRDGDLEGAVEGREVGINW